MEGHVNRIKSIKRQMYGRTSFDLLRKKVILSQLVDVSPNMRKNRQSEPRAPDESEHRLNGSFNE